MKLIVIGANGLIGNAIYHAAKLRGIEVVGTSSKESLRYKKFNLRDDPEIILDPVIKKLGNTDRVFAVVVAGKTNINYCYANKELSYEINVLCIQRLLVFLKNRNITPIYFSSDIVFDGSMGQYKESDRTNPLCIYGKQKVLVENFIKRNIESGLIYRVGKIVDTNLKGNHLFRELYQKYKQGEVLKCISGLKFNPTCLSDIVECVFLGIERNLTGIYHLANSEYYSRLELSKLFFEGVSTPPLLENVDLTEFHFNEVRALNTTLVTGKFQQDIGKYSFISMKVAIEKFWSGLGEYFNEN